MKVFTDWRGSTLIATVTKADAERWRDELLNGNNKRKTARDKLATLKNVLAGGQKQSDGKKLPTSMPLEHLALPNAEVTDSAAKTYPCVMPERF